MKILMKIKAQKRYFSKAIYTSCYLFLLTLFLYFMLQQGYSVIACNTPKELREMNTVAFAHRFAYLDNLYSASVFMHEIPVVSSMLICLVTLLSRARYRHIELWAGRIQPFGQSGKLSEQ